MIGRKYCEMVVICAKDMHKENNVYMSNLLYMA